MSKLSIKTTQNIPLFFTPASIADRAVAFLIDIATISGYLVFVFRILKVHNFINFSDDWSNIASYILVIFPIFLYPLITESLMEGQTLGKKVMKIRVIKIDGYQASFADFFIRWIFAMLEVYTINVIGILSILFSKYSQRLGDIASGTAVITEKNKIKISHSILMDIEDQYKPYFTHAEVLCFSDKDVRIIKEYFTQAQTQKDWAVIGKLADRIKKISKREDNITPVKFVEIFLKDYNFHTTQ